MERIRIEVDSSGAAIAKKVIKDLGKEISKTSKDAREFTRSANLLNRALRRVSTTAAITDKSTHRLRTSVSHLSKNAQRASDKIIEMSQAGRRAAASIGLLERRLKRTVSAFDRAEKGARKVTKETSLLRKAAIAFVAIRMGRQMIHISQGAAHLSDEYTNLRTRIKVVTKDQVEANKVFDRLRKISQETRTSLASTSEAYSRTALSVKTLGVSQNDALKFTETLNKAIKIGGSTTVEANNAMIQLSQGISSNRLSGDELRSVLEQMPVVADLIVKGFNKSHKGVTAFRGDLKAIAKAGLLTSKEVFNAILAGAEEMDDKFPEVMVTIADGWQIFRDGAMVAIGEISQELGIGGAISEALSSLGKDLAETSGAFATLIKVTTGFDGMDEMFHISEDTIDRITIAIAGIKDLVLSIPKVLAGTDQLIEFGLTSMELSVDGGTDKQKKANEELFKKAMVNFTSETEKAYAAIAARRSKRDQGVADNIMSPSLRALSEHITPDMLSSATQSMVANQSFDPTQSSANELIAMINANKSQGLDEKGPELKSDLSKLGLTKKKRGRKSRKLQDVQDILQALRREVELEKMSSKEAKIQHDLDQAKKKILDSNLKLIKNSDDRKAAMAQAFDTAEDLLKQRSEAEAVNEMMKERKKLLAEIDKVTKDTLDKEKERYRTEVKALNTKLEEQQLELREESKALDGNTIGSAFQNANRDFLQSGITLGDSLVEIFGPNGVLVQGTQRLQEGFAKLVIEGQIFGRSWKDISADIDKLSKQVLADVLTQIVNIGVEQAKNALVGSIIRDTEQAKIQAQMGANIVAYNAALLQITTAHTAAMTKIAIASKIASTTASGVSAASGSAIGGSILGSVKTSAIAQAAATAAPVKGFYSGGYTGDGATSKIAGFVHGKEFVMPAEQTAKNRGELEAMKSGKSGSAPKMSVIVNNNAAGVEISTNQIDENTIELIASKIVRRDASKAVAGDMSNPSSKISRAVSKNTTASRRR